MQITKFGHCCLLIEEKGVRILTDPGWFTTEQNALMDIDAVLITHEHADHLHIDSLKEILKNNPETKIITNSGVAKLLTEQNIAHVVVEGVAVSNVKSVSIEAFDARHEEIYEEIGQVQNTGYFIGTRLFYPGDAFAVPGKGVEILALPVAGPWCKISDAIRYALRVKPAKVFPVHDGLLQKDKIGASHRVPETVLSKNGIEFVIMLNGEAREF